MARINRATMLVANLISSYLIAFCIVYFASFLFGKFTLILFVRDFLQDFHIKIHTKTVIKYESIAGGMRLN